LPGSETATRELRQALSIYQQVTSTLRQQVVALRQVPAKRLLQKVTRLVRDVASARGKDIAVILAGEELGLDKAVLDLLDAPLVHLVRNAADHGIELPSDRVAAGKPRQGIIRVSIAENETSMVLTVADDGGGLDLVRIQAKAEEAGLVAAGATLTKDDLVGFIFASGVSTASEVTDISGRGVGLDVVRRAIEGVGGTIGIETERGVGATFSITVPKGARTQIMAGFLVRVADQTFVLPLDRIQRAVALAADQLQRVPERGERLLLDGTTYPHHRLGALTSVAGGGAALAVLIRLGSTVTSLGVDEVLGVRQVLVRPIQSSRFSPMIAGGAIMGDGTVAVVLDPDHLVA
jgi:two-component system chemotaxis sensor kinase CheA